MGWLVDNALVGEIESSSRPNTYSHSKIRLARTVSSSVSPSSLFQDRRCPAVSALQRYTRRPGLSLRLDLI